MAEPGPGVDASGRPVIDPTQNVLQLVEAAIKRQDDLRDAEARHVREIADLRELHAERMRIAEADRINAIRQVDVNAVQRAAEVADNRATTLAGQVSTAAEAMRAALAAALEPIQKDIADLRQAQYLTAGGKTQIVETQAKGASAGLWIGVAVGGFGLLLTILIAAVTVVITLSGR